MVLSTAALVLGGTLAGFLVGRELAVRRRTQALSERLRRSEGDRLRAEADLKATRIDRDYYQERLEVALLDLSRTASDRDRYRTIAASHELTWPDAPPEPQRRPTPIWRGRRYAHHPESNLAALRQDLAPHAAAELTLTLHIEPLGGWTSRTRATGPVVWEGPCARVLAELELFLRDDDLRLMRLDQATQEKVWADADSPLVFRVDLDRVEFSPPGVHIHEVEILHVETRVEERIIEQPVIIEVPLHRLDDPTPAERVSLTREEVLALFDLELEKRLSEFGLQRAEGERLSLLSPHVHATPTDAPRRRGVALQRAVPTPTGPRKG